MKIRIGTRNEAGVSLILVLVALTIFGLLVPILGQFGATSGVSGYIVKGQRYDRYAADDGMDAALAWARDRRTAGRELVDCPTPVTSHITGPATGADRDVTVKCQGFTGSGLPVGDASTPAYAVLTLAGGSHSIDVDSTGNLKTNGAWWANGTRDQTSADIHRVHIDASADLFGASGGCDPSQGATLVAAPKKCKTGTAVGVPPYVSSLASLTGLPADPPVPGNGCAVPDNGVVALAPGIHWDVAWLNRLTDGTCRRDVVIWLEPGPHYFDFDFYDIHNRNTAWVIGSQRNNSAVLIGGVPKGWNPIGAGNQAAAAASAVSRSNGATDAGACDLGQSGAEVVLGSTSHLTVQRSARMELCPVTAGIEQHLSISGPTASSGGRAGGFGPVTPTDAIPSSGTFTWPAAPPGPPATIPALVGQECDRNRNCDPANFLSGDLDGRRNDATVTMHVPNPIPVKTRIDTFTLTISHREQEIGDGSGENNGRDRIRDVSIAVDGLGSPVTCDPLPVRNDWWIDRLNCTLDRPIPAPDPNVNRNLTVTYAVRTNGGDRGRVNVALDQVQLIGRWVAPAIRTQNCNCDTVKVQDGGTSAFVWGTVYLPTGDVNTDFGGGSASKFARGLVAQTLTVTGLPNDTNFVPFELPNGGIYSDRQVQFEAFLGGATDPALSARVQFPDPVAQPGAPPLVKSWNPHKT